MHGSWSFDYFHFRKLCKKYVSFQVLLSLKDLCAFGHLLASLVPSSNKSALAQFVTSYKKFLLKSLPTSSRGVKILEIFWQKSYQCSIYFEVLLQICSFPASWRKSPRGIRLLEVFWRGNVNQFSGFFDPSFWKLWKACNNSTSFVHLKRYGRQTNVKKYFSRSF